MKITVAGKIKEYDDGITVAKLVELENVETPEYVTVTVNDEFVESYDFANTTIKDGDTVEFLYFMGGGQTSVCRQSRSGAVENDISAPSRELQ